MRLNNLVKSLMLAVCAVSIAAASTVNVSSWTPLFQGVDYAYGNLAGPDSSVANAVRVDLSSPGIRFFTTPHSGPLETVAETTSQFVVNSGTAVAVNANFFAPCCTAAMEPKSLTGLAVSNGTVVSAPSGTRGSSNVAFLASSTNHAGIVTTSANQDLSNVYNAVAGSALIVNGGLNIGNASPTQGDPLNPNPRTSVGVSQDDRYVYLVAIDGRQPGYSVGTTIVETADIMLAFGAYTAMNLDGGGSTSLVKSDNAGGAVSLNRPSGGVERYDGNHLGVYALPLAVPEPAPLIPVGFGIAFLLILLRRRYFPSH